MSVLVEPSTSPSLLLAARDGRPEAWRRFVHLYGPIIYRWARRLGCQPCDASDVTQDVLLSVSRDLAKFDAGRPDAKFRGWLWTITRRRFADLKRRQTPEQAAGSEVMRWPDAKSVSDDSSPPTDADNDMGLVVRRAIAVYRDRFDAKTWQAFWATVVQGRDCDEVAQSLGLSRWSVYKARSRILHRLRTELSGLVD